MTTKSSVIAEERFRIAESEHAGTPNAPDSRTLPDDVTPRVRSADRQVLEPRQMAVIAIGPGIVHGEDARNLFGIADDAHPGPRGEWPRQIGPDRPPLVPMLEFER